MTNIFTAQTPDRQPDNAVTNPVAVHFTASWKADQFVITGSHNAEFGHRLTAQSTTAVDGIHARWHWDGRRLIVHNDRYGFYPLFWARLPNGGISVSPSLVQLIRQGAATGLDIEALAVFFRLGYFLGEDTPFKSIRAVPPNVLFEWCEGQLTCHPRYAEQPGQAGISRDDAIDGYIELFAKAIARRPPQGEQFAVPITGGRDSRHILLELHRIGWSPDACVSALDNPPDPNEDPRVAAILCKELGFQSTIVEQRLSPFAAQARKNRETHFCTTVHGWYLALADFLNDRFACVYDGIAGDVLSQSSYLTPQLDAAFHSSNPNTVCDVLFAQVTSKTSGLATLLKGDLRPCLDERVAKSRLRREVEKHMGCPNPVASFILWNRTRRAIALAPYGLLSQVPCVYAPFLDHDLFDFMTALPSSMLLDHKFHDDAIVRAYPKCAHIPYSDKNAKQPDAAAVRTQFAAEAARRFLFRKPLRLSKNLEPRARMLIGATSFGLVQPSIPNWVIYLAQIESLIDGKSLLQH